MNETEYLEGFNVGYKMTKEFPEFAEFLSYAQGHNDKLEGMKDGRSQYLEEQLDKNRDRSKNAPDAKRPEFLNPNRLDDLEKQDMNDFEDLDKDKD